MRWHIKGPLAFMTFTNHPPIQYTPRFFQIQRVLFLFLGKKVKGMRVG